MEEGAGVLEPGRVVDVVEIDLPFGGRYLSVMRSEAPALLPIFRSQAQAELLTWLYLHPGQRFGLTDLARRAGVSLSTAHREAERLVKSQLVSESPLGRNRLLEANLITLPRTRLASCLR